jgi:hypothetical protein
MESGFVMGRILDHLPVFAFVGGVVGAEDKGGEGAGGGRLVNDRRIAGFAEELRAWSFDIERAMGVGGM